MSADGHPGTGPILSGPSGPTTVRRRPSPRAPARRYRPGPPDEVFFPVTPMLDMAFQLLAFFILTFKAPSAETHLDLAPARRPRPPCPRAPRARPGRRAVARGRHRPGERPARPRRGRRPRRPQGAPAGRGRRARPRRPWATASAATPGSSAAARSASASWPTTACATSRPPGSSPPAPRPASPRSAWPSPVALPALPGLTRGAGSGGAP